MLLAQAVAAGGATYLVMDLFMDLPETEALRWVTLGGLAAMALVLFVELSGRHSRHVEMAVHAMTRGEHMGRFWAGVLLGMLAPAAVLIIALATDSTSATAPGIAGLAVIVGMWFYEDSYVRAGQSVPLS